MASVVRTSAQSVSVRHDHCWNCGQGATCSGGMHCAKFSDQLTSAIRSACQTYVIGLLQCSVVNSILLNPLYIIRHDRTYLLQYRLV
ncbi:hypothetical protein EG68_03793 [Paragonimus skrjabini miyazakii]|uniref:Uncharacterized protein n=1 Tax=Paragonimus skrjabini miyazakii TaxID=59628 RepID=A0A8S9YWS5_9TREM|nr:hypothetical protein EG68_03793 [Paragonimus skrjabini miyazakii]